MVGIYKIGDKQVSEKEFNKIVYGRDTGDKSSSSSSKTSSSKTPSSSESFDTLASKMYGKDYSKLNQQQQQQVRASATQAEQQVKISGGSVSKESVEKKFTEQMTEEARGRTSEQTRAEIESRQYQTITKSQTVVPKSTANIISQQQAEQRTPPPRELVLEQQPYVPKSFYYDKWGNPISKQPKFSYQDIEEQRYLVGEMPQQTFVDYLGAKKEYESTLESARETIKTTDWSSAIKTSGTPTINRELTPKEKARLQELSSQKITTDNIDEATQLQGKAIAFELSLQGTSLEMNQLLKFTSPETFQTVVASQGLKSNISSFWDKQALKTTAVVGGTAVALPLIAPYVAGFGATAIGGAITKALGVTYGASVAYRGAKIVTGKQLSFVSPEGAVSLKPTVVDAYEGKPIKRFLEGTQLTAELTGIGLGATATKLRQINPATYKVKTSVPVQTKEGSFKIYEYGTIKTFGGNTRQVVTTMQYGTEGVGSYKTIVTASRGSKPIFQDVGKVYIDSKVFSKSNIQVTKLEQFSAITKKPIPVAQKAYSELNVNKVSFDNAKFYSTIQDTTSATQIPFKGRTNLVFKSSLGGKTTTATLKQDIQPLSDKNIQISSKETYKTFADASKTYKYKQTNVETLGRVKTSTTEGKTFTLDFLTPTSQVKNTITSTNINLKPAFNLKSWGKVGGYTPSPVLEQPLQVLQQPTKIQTFNIGRGATLNLPQDKVLVVPLSRLSSQTATMSMTKTQISPTKIQLQQPQNIKIKLDVKQLTDVKIIQDQQQKTDLRTLQITATKQKQAVITETQLALETPIPPQPTPIPIKIPIQQPPKIFKLPEIDIPLFKKQKTQPYNVLVKRGGKFVKVGTFGSSTQAVKFGKEFIGSKALASFKVVEGGSGRALKAFSFGRDISASKRDPFTFVESRGRRIKSKGELQEITFKGLATPKKKKSKALNNSISKFKLRF